MYDLAGGLAACIYLESALRIKMDKRVVTASRGEISFARDEYSVGWAVPSCRPATIPADQLFQPGSSQWTQSAGPLLDRVSSALRTASPNGQLSIDSYTDNSGQASLGTLTALELTGQQAGAIQKYLIAKGGWNASAVTPQAGGSDLPIMDNQTPAGRAANRRIEFIITQDR